MIKIYFDFEIENNITLDDLGLPEKELGALKKLRDFIYQRVKPLEAEADLQPNGYIWYRLAPPRIEYRYERELSEKMNTCITTEDQMYITTLIQSDFLDLFN